MAKKGRKQAALLASRIKGYQMTVAGDPNRAGQMTKPGSNKKSH